MTGLIDTTEMYLRTIYELEEEGVLPLRARIAERLHQSGPTVSETVARLEREGLVSLAGDRHLVLSDRGRSRATSVMRKHRLAELLLTDVIGLEWEHVHLEACRWEHVISDAVERRLIDLLGSPTTCPHGNPIPGLDGAPTSGALPSESLMAMSEAAGTGGSVVVRRISEHLQSDSRLLASLRQDHLRPGETWELAVGPDGGVRACRDGVGVDVPRTVADHIYVARAPVALPAG